MFSTQTQIIFNTRILNSPHICRCTINSKVMSQALSTKEKFRFRGVSKFGCFQLARYRSTWRSWPTSDTSVEASNVIYKTTRATYSKDILLRSSQLYFPRREGNHWDTATLCPIAFFTEFSYLREMFGIFVFDVIKWAIISYDDYEFWSCKVPSWSTMNYVLCE